MVEMINDELGTDVDPVYEPVPLDNYVYHTHADASKFKRATGWEPEISFEEGVGRVCEPYKERESGEAETERLTE